MSYYINNTMSIGSDPFAPFCPQLICNRSQIDYAEVKSVCQRLFDYRRRQPWPTGVTVLPSWDDLYVLARNNLLDNGDVLPTAAEAVAWANELVRRIEVGV